jgi:hypothetical protein
MTSVPVTSSVARISMVHRVFSSSNLYIAHVQHGGVAYTVEVEAERSDGRLTSLDVEPVPPFADIPTVVNKAGRSLYVAAVRAITAGDTHSHRLLIGVSGSVSAYALGLQRAIDSDQAVTA